MFFNLNFFTLGKHKKTQVKCSGDSLASPGGLELSFPFCGNFFSMLAKVKQKEFSGKEKPLSQ